MRAKDVYAIIGTAAPPYTDWLWQNARAVVGEGKAWKKVREDGQNKWRQVKEPSPRPAAELLGSQMGGPKLRRLSDGRFLVAGRSDATSSYELQPQSLSRLDVFELHPKEGILTRLARLDGFGHYPGVVEHAGQIWISCGRWVGERPEVCLVPLNMYK